MEQYIESLLSRLTLEEKIDMIHGATLFRTKGVERLGIPPMVFDDGPMGVRAEHADNEWRMLNLTDDLVTYLPCNSAVTSTWDRALANRSGSVLGEEARGRGKDIILAPGINIKRSPLCGRNFEYMSEDPYLVEEMVVPMVQGIQSHDTGACVKHFAANSQETMRLSVDTNVDERTLNEIYFPGFKAAIDRAGLVSIMGAYNRLGGEHCCTSQALLNGVLREKWGFDGLIVSDWGGVHDTVEAATSALDVEMDVTYDFDKHYMASALLEKVRAGEIAQECVDEKVRNILRAMYRLKMIGDASETRSAGAYNTPEHRQATLETARESLVLLKNEGDILPLDAKKIKTVALIGANATTVHSNGGGSAEIKALYEITPIMGIKKFLGGNTRVRYARGYYVPDNGGRSEISWQAESTKNQPDYVPKLEIPPEKQHELMREALEVARDADAVIFVGGIDHNYDVEGLDRADMRLPYGQDELLDALLSERPDTVVVLYAGSPVEMPWLSKAKSVLWSYYSGMEGGTAIAETLFGAVDPSGKLAETFIKSLSQCPAKRGVNFGLEKSVTYDEGVFVGYRYYDTYETDVNFCFGHGLSYTRFAYSNLVLDGDSVRVDITNTGARAGKEIVQLYVAPKCDALVPRPVHTLRGFEKVALEPNETKTVTFHLCDRDFSVYDVKSHDFTVIHGEYELQIAASSHDIRLRTPYTKA